MAFMTTAAIASNSNDDETPHPRLPTTTTTTHHSHPPTTSEAALAAAGLLSTTSFSTTHANNSNGTETAAAAAAAAADHEIDAIIARIGARHAIAGYLIVDLVDRSVVRSQMVGSDGRVLFGRRAGRGGGVEGEGEGESAEELVERYAEMCVKFVGAATELSDQFFEQEDGLKLLRLRTVQHELIIIPDPRFVLVVIHELHR
ncbi:hypothetical protein BZA70DRAFT_205902 [Myxozyma melibiosi]|uniref:Roadblock/LAMTOR2 domain-containing protein n=1 Tax=Myxozyma melibiosi TaxID=54550 RepID=A0ABR1F319_9ASCO